MNIKDIINNISDVKLPLSDKDKSPANKDKPMDKNPSSGADKDVLVNEEKRLEPAIPQEPDDDIPKARRVVIYLFFDIKYIYEQKIFLINKIFFFKSD